MYHTETAAAVAAEVLTLIESKPRTLSQEELVAVIARALAGAESANRADAYRASPSHGAVNAYLEDSGQPDAPELDAEPLADTEAERNGIDARLYAVTDDIISRPVSTSSSSPMPICRNGCSCNVAVRSAHASTPPMKSAKPMAPTRALKSSFARSRFTGGLASMKRISFWAVSSVSWWACVSCSRPGMFSIAFSLGDGLVV